MMVGSIRRSGLFLYLSRIGEPLFACFAHCIQGIGKLAVSFLLFFISTST